MEREHYSKMQIVEILREETMNLTPYDIETLAKIFDYQVFAEFPRLIKALRIIKKGRQ